jgi:hypothetical protein
VKATAAVLAVIAVASVAAAGGYLLRDSQTVDAAWSHCVDAEAGYDVQFPSDWHRGGTVEDPGRARLLCRFFDPEPFNIPPNSDFFGTALEVHSVEQTFDDALGSLIDRRFARTVRRDQLTIGPHRAFRLELVATGGGLLARGTKTYAYLVRRLYGSPLLIQTTAPPRRELRYHDIVDHAARTIKLFAQPPPRLTGVPGPVAEKHGAILSALEQTDMSALAALARTDNVTYTFGGEVSGGAAEHWRRLEREGTRVREMLERILLLPYTLTNGIYVWPFAYGKRLSELSAHERELLGNLIPDLEVEGDIEYLGWRAGITPSGRWIFFAAGD